MDKDPFKEYIKETEYNKRTKAYAWNTAIGLQAADGLKTSDYLKHTAVRNIEGEITFDEASKLLQSYYEDNPGAEQKNRTEEADKVSARIAALLADSAFSFTPGEDLSIHRKLFTGIYWHAGKIRNFNISKKEWVSDGDSVYYGSAAELWTTLNYDFSAEEDFSYKGLSMDETIHHPAKFISGLWQIHIFCEGNTRTAAVFFIKYLRTLGFDVTNDIFADNALYFRNALVRANYNNFKKGVYETTGYLEIFLRSLLLNERNPLHNRTLHISGKFTDAVKPDIDAIKPDIGEIKPNIEPTKPDIDRNFNSRTAAHILKLYKEFSDNKIFGRSDVINIAGIKAASASELLKKMADKGITESVSGHGKGKYRFKQYHSGRRNNVNSARILFSEQAATSGGGKKTVFPAWNRKIFQKTIRFQSNINKRDRKKSVPICN